MALRCRHLELMMRVRSYFVLLGVALLCSYSASGQSCFDRAHEIAPPLTKETRQQLEARLAEARLQAKEEPSAENLIWLGRRTAYLGHYREAVEVFTKASEQFPDDARLYRHRGHRYITLRCFDLAIRDLQRAAKLTKGRPDEIEPDGMPNSRNIPTSTLQSNIWYHLGLAYYLKGDFKSALKAYREAEKVSRNPDMLIATSHWLYMTLRRLGREKEAATAIAGIQPDLDIIENGDYYKLIKLYQGRLKAEDLLREISSNTNSLSNASIGYGLGNWFLYNDQGVEAEKIFRQINVGNQWSSFGYIAAEAELKR